MYATALQSQGYFTADLHNSQGTGYADTLCKLYHTISHIQFNYDSLNTLKELSEDARQAVSNVVSLTIQQSVDDYLGGDYQTRDTYADELKTDDVEK